MRKFLLLFSMLVIGAALSAQDVVRTVTPSSDNSPKNSSYGKDLTITIGDYTYTAYGFNNNNWQWSYMACGHKTNSYTATIINNQAIAEKVSKIELDVTNRTGGAKDKLSSNGVKVLVSTSSDFTDVKEYSFDVSNVPTAKDGTGTISVNIDDATANQYYKIAFDCTTTASNNGWLGVNEVRYYGEAEAGAVAAPSITMNAEEKVVITAAEGDIYYTLDGTQPTTASTKYTAPFAVTAKTTVKAIAVVNGKASAVTTYEAVPTIVVSSIAAFLEIEDKTSPVKIDTPLTAVYKNGNNIYVTDGVDYILVYNSNNIEIPELTNGQVLSYITGKYYNFNNLHEFIPTEIGTVSQGTEVKPEAFDIEEIGTDMLNKYIKLSNVTIAAGSKANNFTANDDTKEIILYNKFNSDVTVPEGDNFTVIGFVSIYGSDLQIIPISVTGGEAKEHVATPVFNPASGTALNIGDVIEVTCETEGATFHYTTDGETPTTKSEVLTNGQYLYVGGDLTLKVLAVKDGMLDSDVATATYTEFIDGQYTATFNFASKDGDIANLANKEIEANDAQTTESKNNIDGVEFINGPVKLVINKAEGTTNPRWWANTKYGNQLRPYANNVMQVSIVQDNFALSTIEGIQGSVTDGTYAKLNFTTITTGTWNNDSKVWTAPDDKCVSTELTFEVNSQFGGFNVKYVEAPGNIAGIDTVNVDNSNAPVEYFNLQGVRVSAENIVPGIYVRRQGSQVVKVLVK